jgi:hypothetical protein
MTTPTPSDPKPKWEKHKPGVRRLYGEAVRVTVYRSDLRGWCWVVHTIGRHAHTNEVAQGRCSTQRMALAVGEAVLRVYSGLTQETSDANPE